MRILKNLLSRIERSIAFRTYDKYTIVKTRLKPGYYDKDQIMLHACFALLVDFVEIELAFIRAIGDKLSQKRINENFIKRLLFVLESLFSSKRNEKLGRAYLDEMINCRNGYIDGDDYWVKIKELYEWWKDKRPQRKDPLETTGFSAYLQSLKEKYGDIYYLSSTNSRTLELKSFLNTEEDNKFLDLALKAELLEESNDSEDDEMLLKLCRLRRFLWT